MPPLNLQQKLEVHQRLRHLFDTKMAHLPKSLFLHRQKPTLYDVIHETTQCEFLSGVPRDVDLGWYFSNYNKLAQLGFKAHKGDTKELRYLNRAIWHLQLDRKHTFGTYLLESRMNMLCVLIVYALPNADRVCDTSATATFRTSYKFAWLESLKRDHSYEGTTHQDVFIDKWTKNHDWDLICWGRPQLNRLRASVEKLRAVIPPMPFAIEDFFVESDEQPEDVREQNAALWAIRWLVHKDDEAKAAYDAATSEMVDNPWYEQEQAERIGAIGANELAYLDDPLVFQNSDLLSALMTDIDDNVQVLPKQTYTQWMDPSTAISMVEGKIVGVDMDKLIKHMADMDELTHYMANTAVERDEMDTSA